MDQTMPQDFLNVTTLLESSEPVPRMPWDRVALGVSLLLLIVGVGASAAGRVELQVVCFVLSTGLFMLVPTLARLMTREVRAEQAAVGGIIEMVQLRRWPEAAASLEAVLSKPMQSFMLRDEALAYLAAVLSRYHRFDDAVAIDNYLLEGDSLSENGEHGLKLGRAMAMLREDHLFDADSAISDLRRTGPTDSAGLALVEIYRHVKTGHPDDAIRLFEKMQPNMREQLGHRLGDAYALASRAYDLLDLKNEAADAFRRATLLSPLVELCRRYPEVAKLVGRYEPAAAPVEMA